MKYYSTPPLFGNPNRAASLQIPRCPYCNSRETYLRMDDSLAGSGNWFLDGATVSLHLHCIACNHSTRLVAKVIGDDRLDLQYGSESEVSHV